MGLLQSSEREWLKVGSCLVGFMLKLVCSKEDVPTTSNTWGVIL